MADLVKPYILLQLLQSLLPSNFLEHLDVLKDDLGHDQLRLPVILGVHVPPFSRDVSHAVVVGDGQLLKISQKLMSLRLKALDVGFHVDVFVIHA
jgi:hypothetical protein